MRNFYLSLAIVFTMTVTDLTAQTVVFNHDIDPQARPLYVHVPITIETDEIQPRLAFLKSDFTDSFTAVPQAIDLHIRPIAERNANSNLSNGIIDYGDRVWFEGIARAPQGPDWQFSYELDVPMSTGWVATTLLGYWQCSCLNGCTSHLETDTIPNRFTMWMTPGGAGCGEYPPFIKFTFTSVIRGSGNVGDRIPLRVTLSERKNYPGTEYHEPFAVYDEPVIIGQSTQP